MTEPRDCEVPMRTPPVLSKRLSHWLIATVGVLALGCDTKEVPPPDNASTGGVPSTIAQAATEGVNPPDSSFKLLNKGLCPMRWRLEHVGSPPAWLRLRTTEGNLGPLGSTMPIDAVDIAIGFDVTGLRGGVVVPGAGLKLTAFCTPPGGVEKEAIGSPASISVNLTVKALNAVIDVTTTNVTDPGVVSLANATWKEVTAPAGFSWSGINAVWTGDAVVEVAAGRIRRYSPLSARFDDAALNIPGTFRTVLAGSRVFAATAANGLVGSFRFIDPATGVESGSGLLPGQLFSVDSAIWTGSRVLVFDSGTVYEVDPSTDPPTVRIRPTLGLTNSSFVATGDRVFSFGGTMSGPGASLTNLLRSLLYVPSTVDSWREQLLPGAPTPRVLPYLVYTGTKLIVAGGQYVGASLVQGGGILDVVTNKWSPLPAGFWPDGQQEAIGMVWSGLEVLLVTQNATITPQLVFASRFNPSTGVVTQIVPVPEFVRAALQPGVQNVWTGTSWLFLVPANATTGVPSKVIVYE